MKLTKETRNKRNNDLFYKYNNSSIPIFTQDLKVQIKIEQCVMDNYANGFKKAKVIYRSHICHLKKKLQQKNERIKELEAIINEWQGT